MKESTHTFWKSWKERIQALRNVPPLLSIVWNSGRAVVAGGALCRIVAALVPISMLAVSKRILDAVQAHFAGQPLPSIFWWLVAAEFGLAVFGSLVGRTSGYFDALLADRFTRYVSIRVMEHASRLDLASYEDPVFYDKLERARVQATDRIAMVQALGTVAQQVIVAVSLSAGIMWFSPWLLALLVVAVAPAFLGESHFAFEGYALNIRQTPIRRRLDYLRTLGASKESAKELKLFNLSGFLSAEYTRLSNQLYDQNLRLARRRLWTGAFLSLLSTGAYYGAYAYVIYRTVTGGLSWGSLQFLAGALAGASSNIQSIFATFSSIADQSLFLTDLVEFLRVQPVIGSKPDALPAPRPIRDGFLFDRVSFVYAGSARRVLDDLDLRLEAGERIALIGENGQGKTTIVKLLTRLYDPTAGRILLDGVDLRDYSVEDLHRQIGVIFQDFVRYEMTVRENIATGKVDDAQEFSIRLAARKSLADQVVQRLPGGYRQLLGRRFEGGVDLSGGEWQKVALARAYLRDAQILILDEPTASLDARSEYEVFQRFAELTEGKTALLISHRFSTVRMADRIVVLENGRIAEQGNHQQLVALGGRYSGMFELQASSYR
ncbi:MAG TPA: ABC transporter ATP-binding protein [Bryobacteraceae bacterium]|jgi:ATP-binding cassette subfamily B protein|nr:ABC transporter ATP-binding protein [Bryobacteraceae bacterium]